MRRPSVDPPAPIPTGCWRLRSVGVEIRRCCYVPVCPPGVSVAELACHLSLSLAVGSFYLLLTVCRFYLFTLLCIYISVHHTSLSLSDSTSVTFHLRRLQKRSGQMVSDDFRALLISTGNSLVLVLPLGATASYSSSNPTSLSNRPLSA